MTRSGHEYIEGISDGRQVYINGELVSDVTTHPAFREAVQSIANLYDIANDPANRELMTYDSSCAARRSDGGPSPPSV